ncbi:MAG TPA: hypothetical protein VGN34_01685 [Ktedonobacteraceae bacterium]
MTEVHQESPARGDATLCLLHSPWLNSRAEPGKPPEIHLSVAPLLFSHPWLMDKEVLLQTLPLKDHLLAVERCGVENQVMRWVIHTQSRTRCASRGQIEVFRQTIQNESSIVKK